MKMTLVTVKEKEQTFECDKWALRDGFFLFYSSTGEIIGTSASQILTFVATEPPMVDTKK